MEVSDEGTTLLVRHLPATLSLQDREDLLKHFGALTVTCMPDRGKLKYTAFARFPDDAKAKEALQRLHQLEILDSRLVAEFSNKQHKKHHPSFLKDTDKTIDKEAEPKTVAEIIDFEKSSAESVNSLASKWGLVYPTNPRLQYSYPPPNVTILTNIANALASVPKFYVQVLHLMNKMCLPPPFGAVTPTPPLAEGKLTAVSSSVEKRDQATNTSEQDFDVDSDESEIMSEEEGPPLTDSSPVKRPKRQGNRPKKKPRLLQLIQAPSLGQRPVQSAAPEEVFEVAKAVTDPVAVKPIEFRLKGELEENHDPVQPPLPPDSPPPVGTFGKLEPLARDTTDDLDDGNDDHFDNGDIISSSELRRGRLSSSQLKDFSVFKNYSPGEPSSRLYIKNLSKQTTEKDLHYIFGRYVNLDNEQEKLMFDIRVMKEGRMKGQAFVTLPDETVAKKAVRDTNGFVLNTKPMVVQFARSARPKEGQ